MFWERFAIKESKDIEKYLEGDTGDKVSFFLFFLNTKDTIKQHTCLLIGITEETGEI